MLSATEKEMILEEYKAQKAKTIGETELYALVARELARKHKSLFGAGAPGFPSGIGRMTVRNVVLRAGKGKIADARGRPPALPDFLSVMILAALTSVVSARTTIMSAPMLQPVAIGVIIANGHGSLLNEGRNKRGVFRCGLDYLRSLMKGKGWACVRPQGDTRKLPTGWAEKRWAMVLRLAYFVFVHEIPKALVINADHTGVMFTQVKGRMWITKEARKAKDKSVSGHGDKRQFTLLATTSASGESLPHQVVVKGGTKKSLPNHDGINYKISFNALNTKGKQSVCFTIVAAATSAAVFSAMILANIASFCCTDNHWSDDVTSRAYIKDVAVPYFKRKIEAMRSKDPSACKPFGKQVCVIIIDCWYGWIDASFREWVANKYPWIRFIYVPAACTPVAQPMDAGIIAKIKGKLRKLYGSWVIKLTQEQILKGIAPEAIKVPADVPTCKKNLFKWLSETVELLNQDKEGVVHCWEKTLLLRAWERKVQVEASSKVKELFPNMAHVPTVDLDEEPDGHMRDVGSEDEEAGELGVPFTQAEDEEEWQEWIDWEDAEKKSGGAGASGA